MKNSNRYFQWIMGERRGEVVVLDQMIEEDGDMFYSFKDNSRINVDLVAEINQQDLSRKMMAEVSDPNNLWRFEEIKKKKEGPRYSEKDAQTGEVYEIPSVEDLVNADLSGEQGQTRPSNKPQRKKINLVPPRPTRNKYGQLATTKDLVEEKKTIIKREENVQQQAPNAVQQAPTAPPQDTSDPVYIMMEKARKVDTEVEMTLNVALPTKSLFNVAVESFDEGGEKVIEYIIRNLDDQKLKDGLRDALMEAYGVEPKPEPEPEPEVVESKVTPPAPKQPKEDLPWNQSDVESDLREMKAEQPDPETLEQIEGISPVSYEPEVVEEPVVSEAVQGENKE